MRNNSLTCKVALVGSAGVGKTCIIERFTKDKYDEESESTLTSSYSEKKVNFKDYNKTISFDIWDTAGQEEYRALAKNFYKNASIGILVYDITRKITFEDIKTFWSKELKENGEENMVLAVVGNKSDLVAQEEIKEEEAKEYAESINALFILTSCKESIGIDDLFYRCGVQYLANKDMIKVKPKDNFVLNNNNNDDRKKEKKKCC
jgi:small GTP-binding protein